MSVRLFPSSVCSWRINEHTNLASRSHDVLADCLLFFEAAKDVFQPLLAAHILILWLSFAIVGCIVVVVPATKAFLYLGQKTVKDFVCIRFHEVRRVMGTMYPSPHGDRVGIVFRSIRSSHSIVYSLYVCLTVTRNCCYRGILIRGPVRCPTETHSHFTKVTCIFGIAESAAKRLMVGRLRFAMCNGHPAHWRIW